MSTYDFEPFDPPPSNEGPVAEWLIAAFLITGVWLAAVTILQELGILPLN